jgi:repressor LexA
VFVTRRQQEILEFIREFTAKRGYAPSHEEIQQRFRLGSPATVHKHLKNLEEKGLLRRQPHRSRALELVESEPASSGSVDVPLMGFVAAGRPIEAIEQQESISLPESMLGRGKTYVLKVRGDSMIEDCIQDGDFVIVEERALARNGEMVIACLHDGEVTLKRYYRDPRGVVRLQPANARYEPILVREGEFKIQGVVIGVLRKY